MAENSNIEWTTHTFNPWIGCQKVGPGCDHCYAEAWDARGLQQREGRWGTHAMRTRTSAGNWSKPKAWNKAAEGLAVRPRVFCASLADVFDNHASIPPEWRADLWELIRATPNLDWMLLTKRPGNIAKMLPPDWGDGYQNVWLGCTAVNHTEADRDIPKLLAVPARVRFLSVEPLLGAVNLTPHLWGRAEPCDDCPRVADCDCAPYLRHMLGAEPCLDLVIVGGESGPGARPMRHGWARSLRDQCVAAGVPFFFKQWGEWSPGPGFACPDAIPRGGWHHFDPECSMRRVGKKAAGRLLDGRTWDEMPEVSHG